MFITLPNKGKAQILRVVDSRATPLTTVAESSLAERIAAALTRAESERNEASFAVVEELAAAQPRAVELALLEPLEAWRSAGVPDPTLSDQVVWEELALEWLDDSSMLSSLVRAKLESRLAAAASRGHRFEILADEEAGYCSDSITFLVVCQECDRHAEFGFDAGAEDVPYVSGSAWLAGSCP